jgi:hypothetical protein
MTDDRLANELRQAYSRDLPGGEFDDAVMERALADSGGEHEIAVEAPCGRRWWPLAVAAAVVLLFVGAWQLSGPAPQDAPPFCPRPTLAAPGNERIVVAIDAEGQTSVGKTVLTAEQLKHYLTLRAKECRADGEDEPYVHIEGELRSHPEVPAALRRSVHRDQEVPVCAGGEVRGRRAPRAGRPSLRGAGGAGRAPPGPEAFGRRDCDRSLS